MNILHLSNTPLSNSPSNLAQIQREAGHKVAVLLHRQTNINKVFVGGELWSAYSHEQIRYLFECIDVIHFHNFGFEQEIFRRYPDLKELCNKKACLIQYHSPRKSIENFETSINDPFFKGRRAVVAQYQVRQYPEAEYIVPNVLPIFDTRYTPLASKPQLPTLISYAPSNINLRGWDDKGYDITRTALRNIELAGRANSEIIINTPYEECLLKKKWSDVGIDEVITGSYHLSFLEYMSMGVVAVARMDDYTRAAMAMVIGHEAVSTIPALISPDQWTLERDLLNLISNRAELKDKGKQCRTWMEKHWDPKVFAKYFERIYAKLR
jgi:hypothetical protein